MKVAIDGRALRKTPSGIPNFIVAAVNGLATLHPTWDFYLLSNESFNPDLQNALAVRSNLKIIIRPLKLYNQISFLWLLLKVNALVKELRPDVYWAPAFLMPPFLPANIKSLVTIHDMVYKEYKETMAGGNRFIFNLLHNRTINKADLLWANSNYTTSRIQHYYPQRKCKRIFTGFFINSAIFRPVKVTPEEVKRLMMKYSLQQKFILFVGTLEPRKNLVFLLSLMPELAALGYSLLVIGAKGWGNTAIKTMVAEAHFPRDKVVFAGFVPTDELIKIYNIAFIYVSTSLNEGFGMPQLEAMACGCPVVAPHNSAMIEVVEGAGATVKNWNKKEWIRTIEHVAGNRAHYIEAGFARVTSYEQNAVLQSLSTYINEMK